MAGNDSLIRQLSDGGPNGVNMGQSATDKIGFYGKTPVAQQTVTHVGTTVLSAVDTGKWGFSSSTAGKALISLVQSIQTALHTLGIVLKS